MTRRNLDVGALVLVTEELPRPGSEWLVDEVAAIDWVAGTLHLRRQRRSFDLAFARIAVLAYVRGETVQPVRAIDDARLTIAPDELIMPR